MLPVYDAHRSFVLGSRVLHADETVSDFAAKSLVRPVTIVSDGLACFIATEQAGVH